MVLTTIDTLHHVIDAIRVGAVGFLLKDANPADLMEGVRMAVRGEAFFSTEHAGRAMMETLQSKGASTQDAPESTSTQPETPRLVHEPLTVREQEILLAMAYGQKNHEIAAMLYISEGTVKTHINHIFQ